MVHAGVELGEGPVGLDLVDHQDGAALNWVREVRVPPSWPTGW